MINPLIEIREDGESIYKKAEAAELARKYAKHGCKKCNGTGILHFDNASGRETDVVCDKCALRAYYGER